MEAGHSASRLQRKILSALISMFAFGFIMFNLNCSKKIDPEEVVVARVGKQVITVGDFRRNYEFGLPHLKLGPDRKKSYLNFMIKEKILALEGYRLGFDKSERVKNLENDLMEELLVEELFYKEVNDKVKVTPQEIREAINKSKVSWKLRYWAESNSEYANRICQAMRQRGYSVVVDDILKSNPEVKLKPQDFESDYLTWLEVSPKMLDVIKDLPIGEISEPVELDGVYFIFQIIDIHREGVTEQEYANKAESFQKILFYRKAAEQAKRFVSGFMSPKNVVTKGDAFRKLAEALAIWKHNEEYKGMDFLEVVENADESQPQLYRLKKNLQQTLVNFHGGTWTIKDFIARMNPRAIKADPANRNLFLDQLNEHIALKVRNYFFVKEAEKRGLVQSARVKKQLQQWRDKWVYDEVRRHYTASLKIDDDLARNYFKKFKDKYKIHQDDEPTFTEYRNQVRRDVYIRQARSLLGQKVDSLKRYFPVQINQAVLDTITTIDSQKSRWMSLQVFKRSSNRLAAPIVDPAWGF